eukprot:TRINITY_DN5455_c0_g1_i1.p1 TRINITY_DN5455_c0_g1~~TRINITY_DN5455_c0_g1_i1.p1  ORF type:complete len:376 (+),score=58.14 TRINITY_DN5455_c0_g1_i1:32-1159(+)
MALCLELQPARAAGAFRLGMPIAEAVQYLQKHSRAIRRVDVVFDDLNPLSREIKLHLVNEGVVLYFEPVSQRLQLVEITDFGRLSLSYSGQVFSSPSSAATFVRIYQLFGPTYPGTYSSEDSFYVLNYPGLSFFFYIPPEFSDVVSDGQSMPLELPNSTTPVAHRIRIYHGRSPEKPTLPATPPGLTYWEPIEAHVAVGACFPRRRQWVRFGDSPQDVTTIFGTPDAVFYKDKDRLRIHSIAERNSHLIDYFYNYFSKGFDLMFDGTTHLLKKIILHTNFPGSTDFNFYSKANFTIVFPKEGSGTGKKEDTTRIDPNSTWQEIQEKLGPCSAPLVNDYSASNNPFGGTKFFASQMHHVVFEVLKNGHIASVNIYH